MSATLSRKFASLKRDTLARWRGWAVAIADGAAAPSPMDVLEAGAILGIDAPMAALEADANAVAEVRELEDRAAALKAKAAEQLAEFGGAAGLRERIGNLRRELARLQALEGPERFLRAGQLAGEASRLRAGHSRVFAAPVAPSRGAR